MSKKKINNRLDRLFEDIDKEPESKQTSGPESAGKKEAHEANSDFLFASPTKNLNPNSTVEFPSLEESSGMPETVYQSSSTMLSTAFRTDEKNWATLKVVDESKQRTWGTEEQMLVKQVADQLSLALENARLFQEAQRRAREMTALADVAREISATLELQQVMERISNQALLILNAVTSAVYVPDPRFETLIAITASGDDADEIKSDGLKMGEGLLGSIARKKTAAIINDATNNPNSIKIKGTEDCPHEHLMAAPILSQNQLSGLLAVWRIGENEQFSSTELEFLSSLAQQAAIAVENARLFEETQERAEELSVLNEMARELSAEMNLNGIADTAYRYTNRLIHASDFYIALYDEDSDLISFPVFIEGQKSISVPARKFESGLTEHVLQTKRPFFLNGNEGEQKASLDAEGILPVNGESTLCWLGTPLVVGNKSIGVMAVQSFDTPYLFGDHEQELLLTVASQVAISLENARLFKDAQARARREKILREITARIRATNDPEMIAKAAVRELGQALGVRTFIRLGGKDAISSQDGEIGEARMDNTEIPDGGA